MIKDIWTNIMCVIISVIIIAVHILSTPTIDSVDELKSYVGVCEDIYSPRRRTYLEMSNGTRFAMKVGPKRGVLNKAVEDGEVFKIGYVHNFFTGMPTVVTLEIGDRVKSDLEDWNSAVKKGYIILIGVFVFINATIALLSIPPKYKRIENKNRRAKARAKKAKEKAKKQALKNKKKQKSKL